MSEVLTIELRNFEDSDLAILFQHQRDPDYVQMAAFTGSNPDDWDAFHSHAIKVAADKNVIQKVILLDGQVAGSVAKFQMFGKTQICYGVAKSHWGKGATTIALQQFLAIVSERPLYAQVASDNLGSIRVLEKCGFKLIGKEMGYANARKMEIEESIFELV